MGAKRDAFCKAKQYCQTVACVAATSASYVSLNACKLVIMLAFRHNSASVLSS